MEANTEDIPAEGTPPWMNAEVFRPVPPSKALGAGYFLAKGEGGVLKPTPDVHALRRVLGRTRGDSILTVWMPGDRFMRTVYEVDELADVVEERTRAEAKSARRRALPRALLAVLLVAAGIAVWPIERPFQMMALLGTMLLFAPLWRKGVEALIDTRLTLRTLRADPEGWRRRQAERLRYEAWSTQGHSWTGFAFVGASVLIALLTLFVGSKESFDALALVKSRTAGGEYWRLFTCTLLHAGFLHIYFNLMVGLSLATAARRLVSESRVLLVFLVTGIAGSAASLLLSEATSVGASGAILGWGGMLVGLGISHPAIRHTGVVSNMLRWVFILALIGLAGTGIIDNAAHAGGFVSGLLLGIFFGWRGRDQVPPIGGDRLTRGFWFLAVLGGGGALAMIVVLIAMLAS